MIQGEEAGGLGCGKQGRGRKKAARRGRTGDTIHIASIDSRQDLAATNTMVVALDSGNAR